MDKKQGPTSRVVVLKLKPLLLRAFPSTSASTTANDSGSSSGSPRNSSPLATTVTPQVGSPVNSEATPTPTNGSKPGPKRGRQSTGSTLPGKPGRKKQKLDNGVAVTPVITGPAGISHAKLGPKANQGAINAQLRALDRTGKPCKRWAKAGFSLKSFTGVQWTVPTWATPSVETRMELSTIQAQSSADTPATSTVDQLSVNGEALEAPMDMMEVS